MRRGSLLLAALAACLIPGVAQAEISGDYLEMRSCDIYTGPCFANAEVGLTGSEALMAWNIEQGDHQGVDLAGLKVVVAIKAENTLTFGGGMSVKPGAIKSVILADDKATDSQREALVAFAKQAAGRAIGEVQKVQFVPIAMTLDHVDMAAQLKAGDSAEIVTRKLGKADCVCSNEEIFYPPLASVDNFAPAYSQTATYRGQGLGATWQCPSTRSSFLATFAY